MSVEGAVDSSPGRKLGGSGANENLEPALAGDRNYLRLVACYSCSSFAPTGALGSLLP
jgi:hypothetical protein